MNNEQLKLAISLGDPAGIGPEVVLKALAETNLTENYSLTVIGSLEILKNTHQALKNSSKLVDPETLSIIDIPTKTTITIGEGNAESGAASFAYLETAINQTLEGKFQGIVTAPIAKSCWQAAGYNYPGQTEVLANKAGVGKYGMLFVGRSPYTNWILRTLLATTHIPLAQVPTALNSELMTNKLELLIDCLKSDFGLTTPRIMISGLNPHSGEQGKLGTEEQDWLIPWLEEAQKNYPQVELIGPVPPDTLWVKPGLSWYQKIDPTVGDAYLALYHDQGLIPVKLMAFDQAVNTTIGLPFVRTSPDHGTAFDIAGKGIAKADSMIQAIKLAIELAQQRLKSYGDSSLRSE